MTIEYLHFIVYLKAIRVNWI